MYNCHFVLQISRKCGAVSQVLAYGAFEELKYTMFVTYFHSSFISICNVILRVWFLLENGGDKSKYVTMAVNLQLCFSKKINELYFFCFNLTTGNG